MLKKILKLPISLVGIFMFTLYLIDLTGFAFKFTFSSQTTISCILFICGIAVIATGGYFFRKANTTVDPTVPEEASSLVKNGIYKYSRNPMYIGFLLWLVACALFFGNTINILLLPIYVALVNKLYIIPEEEALRGIFGDEFEEYSAKVGRWI